MNRKILVILLTIQVISYLNATAQTYPYSGVWQSFDNPIDFNPNSNSPIRGRLLNMYWQDLQPTNSTSYNFSGTNGLDQLVLNRTLSNQSNSNTVNVPIILSIFIYSPPSKDRGNDDGTLVSAPQWLWNEKHIPLVKMTFTTDIDGIKLKGLSDPIPVYAPYYNCQEYVNQFTAMVNSVKDRINGILNGQIIVSDPNVKAAYKKILGVQACYGSSGDYLSYKGDNVYYGPPENLFSGSCTQYTTNISINSATTEIKNQDIKSLFKAFSSIYQSAYYDPCNGLCVGTGGLDIPKIKDPNDAQSYGIHVLHNPDNQGKDNDTWLQANCSGTWRKNGIMGKNYQVNYENDLTHSSNDMSWWYSTLNTPFSSFAQSYNYDYIKARSELVGGTTKGGWWTGILKTLSSGCTNPANYVIPRTQDLSLYNYPYKNLFTLYGYMLYWGIDWANETHDILTDPGYAKALDFFNRNAGQKTSETATNGFCLLRDGLDTYDTERFPTNIYGSVLQNGSSTDLNLSRMKAIVQLFTNNGALFEDPCTAVGTTRANREAGGINDIGAYVLRGNYERYVTQINPDPNSNDINKTSTGYWNVLASSEQNSIFGRYARGISNDNSLSPKNTMYFKINFYTDATGTAQGLFMGATITLTYLDNSIGTSWDFYYNKYVCNSPNTGGTETYTKLGTVILNGTNKWQSVSFSMGDGVFGGGDLKKTDFSVTTNSETPIKFALIEVSIPIKAGGNLCNVLPGFSSKKKEEEAIQIFPNPATQNFAIQSIKKDIIKEIKIFNMYNQIVLVKKVNSSSAIFSKFQIGNKSGLYFIIVTTLDGSVIRKELNIR